MNIELTDKRTHNQKYFDNLNGTFTQKAHVGHVHYFNKLKGEQLWR